MLRLLTLTASALAIVENLALRARLWIDDYLNARADWEAP